MDPLAFHHGGWEVIEPYPSKRIYRLKIIIGRQGSCNPSHNNIYKQLTVTKGKAYYVIPHPRMYKHLTGAGVHEVASKSFTMA